MGLSLQRPTRPTRPTPIYQSSYYNPSKNNKVTIIKRYRSLHIGINYNGTNNRLYGCINDAKNHLEFIQEHAALKRAPLISQLMSDESTSPLLQPTVNNIIRAIGWLFSSAPSSALTDSKYTDFSVFPLEKNTHIYCTYAGHGGQIKDRNGDEKDGKDETLIALDGIIIDDTLRETFNRYLMRGIIVNCVYDCCNSGTILDLRYTYNSNFVPVSNRNYDIAPCRIECVSGCMDYQYAYDKFIGGKSVGAMSYCLLKLLREGNNNLSYRDLVHRLQQELENVGAGSQDATLSFGHIGGGRAYFF